MNLALANRPLCSLVWAVLLLAPMAAPADEQAQFDFANVLADKNAEVSVRQIIRELEASLTPVRSPMIMNGGGFGLFANHSLVMANYMARANAAVINLRELLDQG